MRDMTTNVAQQFRVIAYSRNIDGDRSPAHHIERSMLESNDRAVIDPDQHGPFGARLARVSTLKIAGIDDVRMFAEHDMGVDMAQRPVIIAMIGKLFRRAGGITGVMTFAARACCVQHADVK